VIIGLKKKQQDGDKKNIKSPRPRWNWNFEIYFIESEQDRAMKKTHFHEENKILRFLFFILIPDWFEG